MSKKEILKTKSNKIALKPNRVIQAGQQMSPFQQKVFIGALALFEFSVSGSNRYSGDELDKLAKSTFTIPAKELFDDFKSLKLSRNAEFTREIEQKVDDLVKQSIRIRDESSFTAINIMDYAKYDYENETINIQFSKAIVPILLDMFDEGFTRIRLVSFMKFRSGYSMRIYEELLRVRGMTNVIKSGHILTIYELRFLLGLDMEKMYLKYDNFRQRVLLPAQKEIKEKAGLLFEFEEIRRGKPVYQIRFYNIKEDPDFVQEAKQLSLFSNNIDFSNSIPEPEEDENFLIPILENAKQNIIMPKEKMQIEQEIIFAEVVEPQTPKFTKEQLDKLDKYLEDVFSAEQIKRDYEFDYIEFYYNKAQDLQQSGSVRNFPSFLFRLLEEDKYGFQELKQKAQKKKEREIAERKAEFENRKKAEQAEKEKKEKEKAEIKRWENLFDSLDEQTRKKYLNEVYEKNEFYKSLDKDGYNKITKWAVGKLAEDNGIIP